MDFGNLLRKERDRLGMSRREVGEKAGLSEQYIYDVETNKKTPSLETVNRLAETYGNPGLLREYMILNDIDIAAIAGSTLYGMCRRIEQIVENNEEAFDEWTKIINNFIGKYEK